MESKSLGDAKGAMATTDTPPIASSPRWGLLATAAWFSGAGAIYALAQLIALIIFLDSSPVALRGGLNAPTDYQTNGPLVSLLLIFSSPLVIGVFVFASYLSRISVREYLGLVRPSRSALAYGLAACCALVLVSHAANLLSDREPIPDFMRSVYESAQRAEMLLLLVCGLTILAPIAEEIAFRGFLFRGIATRLGAPVAIAVTAIGWGFLHAQYDLFQQAQIAGFGLVFGWMRWRFGSTILTILMHGALNAIALVQVALSTNS